MTAWKSSFPPALSFESLKQVLQRDTMEARKESLVRIVPHLPANLLAVEQQLYATKWYDYRFVGPVAATRIFAKAYENAFRAKWTEYIDIDASKKKSPIRLSEFYRGGALLTSMWRARQIADENGLPYRFFCRSYIDSWVNSRTKRFPRPNQLMDHRRVGPIVRRWNEEAKALKAVAKLSAFRTPNFEGHHAQIDHRAWVLVLLEKSTGPEYTIANLCIRRDFLPLDILRDQFRMEIIDRAIEEAAKWDDGGSPIWSDIERPPTFRPRLMPSCFGVPFAARDLSDICNACPQKSGCGDVAGEVVDRLVTKYGRSDPHSDTAREAVRKRVEKHRRKKRAESLGSAH